MKSHSSKKQFAGTVVSTKMKDTVVVRVDRYAKHPLYGKFIRHHKRYLVHDHGNTASEGDKVVIEETRPLSRNKHFRLVGGIDSKKQPS